MVKQPHYRGLWLAEDPGACSHSSTFVTNRYQHYLHAVGAQLPLHHRLCLEYDEAAAADAWKAAGGLCLRPIVPPRRIPLMVLGCTGKRWTEVLFLAYSPFWMIWALCILVPFKLYDVSGRSVGSFPPLPI